MSTQLTDEQIAELGEHPTGTVALISVFGVLFFVGWLFFYFVLFAGRGQMTH